MAETRTFFVQDQPYEMVGLGSNDAYFSSISGRFELKFQQFCENFLRKDAVAIDVGANIGITSIILAHFLDKGKVLAVEPGRGIFALLEENIQQSKHHNIISSNIAIADSVGKMEFLEHSAYGHLIFKNPNEINIELAVQTRTMEDLLNVFGIDHLDFIKIDTEGFEPQVFSGAWASIEKYDPIILFEFNSWALLHHGDNNPLHFARSICQYYGKVYRLNKDGENLELELIEGPVDAMAAKIVHDNMVYHGSWDDLVVCRDSAKIDRMHQAMLDQRTAEPGPPSAPQHPSLADRMIRRLRRSLHGA